MIERRFIEFNDPQYESRIEKAEDGKRYIMGYAALKNSSTKITERINGQLLTFTETIGERAFDKADMTSVFHLVEHNPNRIIGRTGVNTTVSLTDKGLFFRTEINPEHATTEQLDLLKNVELGLIKGASFGFRLSKEGQVWEKRNGELFRTITNFSKVFDVTSTIAGAYDSAFTFTRSLDESEMKEIQTEQPANDIEKDVFEFEFIKLRQF
jgi:HK97 family phage prohead protease